MQQFLSQDIQFLPGVGPKRADVLRKEINIQTFEDLLFYFPYKYIDRSRFYSIREISSDLPYIQIRGRITGYTAVGRGSGRRLSAGFTDGNGMIELVWFKGAKWIPESFPPDKELIIFGKPTVYKGKINIIHPEIEDPQKLSPNRSELQAMYVSSEKMKDNYITSRTLSKFISTLISLLPAKFEETLPAWLLKRNNLVNLDTALRHIHFPNTPADYQRATLRLKFEELFYIQLNILQSRYNRTTKYKGVIFSTVGEQFSAFYNEHLPFELTEAQKRAVKEIRKDTGSGHQMNRLLQGDVGSGKTLVALMSMLIAIDNGYQTCIMAPTEILAAQHFQSISKMLGNMDLKVGLLTGSSKKAERAIIHENLLDGSLNILIGTHALLEDVVQFANLGLVVIDEQHRFGVAQRARLWQKSDVYPHILVMTATPIPRTLAMTLYGDLDVTVIDELPPGRKPIITKHTYDSKRLEVFGFLRREIKAGRQVYIVYPLIKESEKMDYKDLEDGLESISRAFPPPEYFISVVHGKMKSEEKEIAMGYFISGRAQIMIATTVIEVGVDVPNATIMVIESAERFGLSQLHQLRGRVGRGGSQSYCILMTGYKLSDDSRRRIETMVRTNDGFEIAEEDLRLRGPGDIEGTQQSGIPFNLKIAHLGRDGQILELARRFAEEILNEDPDLALEKNHIFRKHVKKNKNVQVEWGNIS